MPSTTTTYSFQKPTVTGDEDDWGGYLNANWDALDDLLDGTTVIDGGPVIEDTMTIVDPADNTKAVKFDLGANVTTGNTRILYIPDVDGTVTLNAANQTLSNKTLTNPTINAAALSGTITGGPTFAGNLTLSGNPAFTGNPSFAGVGNAATIRTQLGVAIGSDVQAYDAVLADLAGLTLTAGDVLYWDGSNLTNLGIGTAGQLLQVNSEATAPEWVADQYIGVGQTWQDMSGSRTASSTSYQNTTGKPIAVTFNGTAEVSSDGSTWVGISNVAADTSFIVPDDHYYRNTAGSFTYWAELR